MNWQTVEGLVPINLPGELALAGDPAEPINTEQIDHADWLAVLAMFELLV